MLSRRTLLATGGAALGAAAVGVLAWPNADDAAHVAKRQRALMRQDPDLSELVRMATLAPNGHNTQPWTFRLGENAISILPDLSRGTHIVDPDDHHLFVSLGCAAENLQIAARAHGRTAEAVVSGGAAPRISLSLSQGVVTDQGLYEAIPFRQSTRAVFDGQSVSTADLNRLKSAGERHGVRVLLFTEPRDIEAILDFVIAGNSVQMDDPEFRRELLDWIRFSPDRAIETGDGLFGACSGNPVVPEWLGKHMFNLVFAKDTENQKYRDHVRSSAGIAVFVGAGEDAESWINVGRSFERFALEATRLGIRNAHLNMPIEVPAIRPEFARWLGEPEARPDLIVRFGRAPALPMSLRRPVDDVLEAALN